MKFKINTKLLPMKAHYFLWYAGTAPVQPHMTVYAKQLGFSSQTVGTIWAVLPFLGIFANPVFGILADKFQKQKFLFLLFQILTTLTFFSIQFIPEVSDNKPEAALFCNKEGTYIQYRTNDSAKQCLINEILDESKFSNETAQCQMECELPYRFRDEVCNTWNYTGDICKEGAEYVKSTLKFKVLVPDKYIRKVDPDGIYALISTIKLTEYIINPQCENSSYTYCAIDCDYTKFTQVFVEENKTDGDVTNLYQFWLLFGLMAICWIGQAVVVCIADAICFELLGADRAKDYGKQRLWGSLAWGIFAVISGLIVDEISKGQIKKNYTPAFYFMIVFLGFNVFFSYKLKYEQVRISTSLSSNIWRLVKDIKIDFFILWCLLMGVCTGIQWNFFFWFIEELAKNEKGCNTESRLKTLEGIIQAFQSILGEIPAFFLSGWIIQKIGHITAMTIVPLLISIRFFLYSVVTNPWWVLPIELFSATYGLFYTAMTSHASLVAPPGTKATVLGLVDASFGVGVSAGTYLGGSFFYVYGGAVSFRIFGVVALVLFVLHGAVQFFLYRNKTNYGLVDNKPSPSHRTAPDDAY